MAMTPLELTNSATVATSMAVCDCRPSTPMATKANSEAAVRAMKLTSALMLLQRWYSQITTAMPGIAYSAERASSAVAVAASNNPLLTTLVSAVSGQLNPDVNLVDTLNGDEFTVFAPVDDAFAAVDQATLDTLSTDADLLTSVLTYHVVPGQIEPADIAGMHTTVQGADVEVTGSGDEWMVNDAMVLCGGVQTANATVYLIDSVLMPPAE